MNGDKAIRRSTIAAVTVVAIVAGWVSYRHALTVTAEHGETGWLGRAYPLTIDGLIYSASMVLLNAARQRVRAHWLAYGGLGLGVVATLAANIAAGLARGIVGAVVGAWPAVALVISYELLMIVIRSAANAPPAQNAAEVPADALAAAKLALSASVKVGNPISQRQMIARFGITRTAEREMRAELLAASNGHAPAEQ